jgi:hypothetical protein
MKKNLLSCILVLGFIILSSGMCSKKDSAPALLEKYPQYWILTIDESADKYTYLRTNGANMFRKSILKTYSLTQLAIDEDCEFEAAQSKTEYGNKDCITLRLDKNKKIWIGVTQSPNKQEWHLNNLNGNSTDPGDGYKFFVHRMPDVGGVKTVAIESVQQPGWYISSAPPGFNYAANQVTLQQAASPEMATHWQCR